MGLLPANVGDDTLCISSLIAKNVSATNPLNSYFVKLDGHMGTLIYSKDITFSNHIEYGCTHVGFLGDGAEAAILITNDCLQPYSTRVTKLSDCSDFTYSFNATTTLTSVSGINCNNGKIKVNLTGTFNSWPHLELYNSASVLVAQADTTPGATSYTFKNLTSGSYTVKVYDEGCGEQVFNVTVQCAKPSSGFSVTGQTSNSAQVNWNNSTCFSGYRVQYRLMGTSPWTTVTTTTNNKVITGLNPLSTYQWRVATQCTTSTPVTYSSYTNNMLLTTLSPYLENTQRQTVYYSNDFEIAIAPNPVSDKMMITSETDIPASVIKVFNAQGQLVLEKNINALNENETVEMETGALAKGIYLLQVISEEGMVTKRFVKE
jgi:uncharacterized protein (DUF2141 family)